MPSVTRVHSSDSRVFLNDFKIKGVQEFNYETKKNTTPISKLGSYKTEDYILNSDQPISANIDFLISDRVNLQDSLTSNISSLISGLTHGAGTQELFTNYNTFSTSTVSNLVRNTNCWVHNVKGITGIIAWNDRSQGSPSGTGRGGVAITKRHILYAKHASYQATTPPTVVYFVTKNNTTISRTITQTKDFPTLSPANANDYGVALLNEDLPDSIEFVKVLPRDSYQYFDTGNFSSTTFSGSSGNNETLSFFVNQDELAKVSRVNQLEFEDFDYRNPSSNNGVQSLTISSYSDWHSNPVNGDSGSPHMLIINNECILLGLFHNNGISTGAEGPFVSSAYNYKTINEYIKEVDKLDGINTGYQLSPIDLAQEYRPYRSTEHIDFLSHEESTLKLQENAGTTTISKAYLTNYSLNFDAGELAKGSFSYEGGEISTHSSSEFTETSDTFNVFAPKSLSVTSNFLEGIDSTNYAIQSCDISLPISRTPIVRVGQRVAKIRIPELPAEGSVSFSVIKKNVESLDLSNLVLDKGALTFTAIGNKLSTSTEDNVTLNIKVENCCLNSISNSNDLDGNATLNFNYIFPIANDSIAYYFS